MAAAGAISVNVTANTLQAYAANHSVLTTASSGSIRLKALDSSVISAIGGGLAGSGAGGSGGGTAASVGAAIAVNVVANQNQAYIDSSTVSSAGSLDLSAKETGIVSALSIGAAVAGAGGAGGGTGGSARSSGPPRR